MVAWNLIIGLAALAVAVKYLLDWLLHTEFGLCLQATGDNESMIRAMGTNTNITRIVGLGHRQRAGRAERLAGGAAAGFADVGMGIGTIVAGLAGVIMGEVLFGVRSISWVLFSVIGGSIVYRLLIAVSLRLGIAPTDLKLLDGRPRRRRPLGAHRAQEGDALVNSRRRQAIERGAGGAPLRVPEPLELAGIRKIFFPGTANEVVALNGIDLVGACRPVREHHRLERVGQVHAPQRGGRDVRGHVGQGAARRTATSPGSPSTCAAGPSAGCSRTPAPAPPPT